MHSALSIHRLLLIFVLLVAGIVLSIHFMSRSTAVRDVQRPSDTIINTCSELSPVITTVSPLHVFEKRCSNRKVESQLGMSQATYTAHSGSPLHQLGSRRCTCPKNFALPSIKRLKNFVIDVNGKWEGDRCNDLHRTETGIIRQYWPVHCGKFRYIDFLIDL